ncbi:MAG: hypothetical protein MUF54_05815 [Polyangiaceae bacterium]|jgi:hypothetical protein|nr:hypothetical protein [Polyangiaceae bacterium]
MLSLVPTGDRSPSRWRAAAVVLMRLCQGALSFDRWTGLRALLDLTTRALELGVRQRAEC